MLDTGMSKGSNILRRINFLVVAVSALLIGSSEAVFAPFTLINVGRTNDGGFAEGITVSGNYVYLANDTDGLRVYDVSNPANPINVCHTNDGSSAIDVVVSNGYLYLANYDDGLRIYDNSVPTNLVNVGHINNGGYANNDG